MRLPTSRFGNTLVLCASMLAAAILLPNGCSAGLLDNLSGSLPSIGDFTKEKPTITTSLKDAVTEVTFLDDFNPTDFAPMTRLTRGPNNGFILDRPGLFELDAQSYCLHAGAYAPGKGEGYVYAPISGPRADVIRRIAQQSVVHPEIDQHDVQTLIWAILARTKISDMSGDMRKAASALLTEKDITELNGGALGKIPDALMDKLMGKVSDAMRPIFQAESKIRDMLTTSTSSFDELEKVAVLVGDPEPGEGSREIPEGRWSYSPDGYFVRYSPSGYSQTLIQLYVPEAFAVERDSQNRITAISDARGNRIETEYDDQIAPVAVSGDPGVKACAFRSIRFVNVRYIGPEFMKRSLAKWENVGWTLVGMPSGKGTVQSPTERFSDLAKRYADMDKLNDQVLGLAKTVDKLTGNKGDRQKNANVIDLGSYVVALTSALSGKTEGQGDWASNHAYMAQKAWQAELCAFLGGCSTVAMSGTTVASANLMGLLAFGSDDDPCAGSPRPGKGKEFDPSGQAAMPGNTDRQRLLQSAADSNAGGPNPDGKAVSDRLKELQTIYNAFKNNLPRQGEDGDQYYARIEGILGYDESKGGVSPMGTDAGSCTIIVNESLYANEPPISRAADCAHEKSHQARCRWARDHATGGYPSWMSDANNYRKDEMDAYQAGMNAMRAWQAENGYQ
jgi:YD repeat-containing protein